MNDQLGVLRKDLNETKSQVVLAEYKRETDFQEHERKAQEEISSLQHFVHGTKTFLELTQKSTSAIEFALYS